MNLKLTRRQFGQAAIATTVVATVGTFVNKTLAQTPSSDILGLVAGSTITDDLATPEIESTENIEQTISKVIALSTSQPLVVRSLNRGLILTSPPILEFADQITGFAILKDGTQVVATTSTTDNRADQLTRLLVLGASPKTVTISGLKKQETIIDLFTRKNGSLGALVGKRNGTSPMSIVSINSQTGQITDEDKLSGNVRVTTVAECPDGNLYGISVDRQGTTSLLQINSKNQTTPLTFNAQPWNSGFSGLVCSSSNELFALGARRYESPKYLHTINKSTGVITRIKDFDVARIAI
ncbi:MAG: hypothetical protein KME49_18210 [Brasilonema octagenarum HA4186-MV1]|jgi:hypothetical protein|uniref:Uncharacterized protein n=1 Tax=Brasilonema octagenarum UFV-OR1 TaxID=417115 RepID=A0ABX1M162_9CYAN|nr:hypothetical protein [Brasilonema octagenarum]MBW4627380.1 hypothetical protein [Brasilonema octagenarum HA4186-MV1]NMF62243.1 hypothetical protein [Brasilonema octagenarum UFV-OR1]